MRNVDHGKEGELTKTEGGVGFAELWIALELVALSGVRSRHFLPNRRIRECRRGEITRHGGCRDKECGKPMRQCKSSGEWKAHRVSEALFQMR